MDAVVAVIIDERTRGQRIEERCFAGVLMLLTALSVTFVTLGSYLLWRP
jgi:hypothetical protein